jgi:hypothetical protein
MNFWTTQPDIVAKMPDVSKLRSLKHFIRSSLTMVYLHTLHRSYVYQATGTKGTVRVIWLLQVSIGQRALDYVR